MKKKLKHEFNLILTFLIIFSALFPCSYSSNVLAKSNNNYTTLNISSTFDSIFPFENGVAKFEKGGLYGLVDQNGKIIADPQFSSISSFKEGFAVIKKNSKYGFISESGVVTVAPQFTKASDFSKEGLAQISNGTKWGFINKSGTVLIEPRFDSIYDFKDGFAKIREGGKYGFVDKNGVLVLSPQFDDASDFQAGMASVKKSNKWGSVDEKGNFTDFNVDDMQAFQDGLAPVKKNDKWGLANTKGDLVLNPEFNTLSFLNKNLIKVTNKSSYYGIIDRNGKAIVDSAYQDISPLGEGYLLIKNSDVYGIADSKGTVIFSPQFDWIYNVQEGKAIVNKDNKYGFVDISTKKLTLKSDFDMIYSFDEGLARVKKGDKYGFINDLGNTVVSLDYDDASDFNEGVAAIMKNDGSSYETNSSKKHWGFINRVGSTVIQRDFNAVTDFKNGTALLKKTDTCSVIKIADIKYVTTKTDIDPFKAWNIKFNIPLDDSSEIDTDDDHKVLRSINKTILNNIKVTDSSGHYVTVSFKYESPRTVTINPPVDGYKKGEKYKITILNDFKSKDGNNLEPSVTEMNFSITDK